MWGSNPYFNIHGKLSYQRIVGLIEDSGKTDVYIHGGSSKNYCLQMNHHAHPKTQEYERCACLKMYRTDILIFFKDGTVIVDDYDSSITRDVLNQFGPIHVFKDTLNRARTKQRFGAYGGANYPMRGPIVIDPKGVVRGLRDTFRRVKKSRKKARSMLGREFRRTATARILLGEFGNAFGTRSEFGYRAAVPLRNVREVINMFIAGADHDVIAPHVVDNKFVSHYVFGRARHLQEYPTPELAAASAMKAMLHKALKDSYQHPDFEDYDVKYPPVKVW